MSLFLSAFSFIFLAALPGRTTFLMVLMSARERPMAVFWGSAGAFVLQAMISIALGNVLSLFPENVIHVAVGLLLCFFAVRFWRHSNDEILLATSTHFHPVRSAFLTIFAAEWGDVSQLAIASYSAQHHERFIVFFSAVAALFLIAGMAVVAGTHLHRAIKPVILQKVAAIGFGSVGAYILLQVLVWTGK